MEKLKLLHQTQTVVLKIVFWFWIIETVVFLFIDGWHWKAVNPIEIQLDQIVSVSFGIWVVLLISTINELLTLIIKANE